jgi:hypothetical protein
MHLLNLCREGQSAVRSDRQLLFRQLLLCSSLYKLEQLGSQFMPSFYFPVETVSSPYSVICYYYTTTLLEFQHNSHCDSFQLS